MWFKAVILSKSGGVSSQGGERSFDQEKVTIGRGAGNDIKLDDPLRVISSKHAEIRRVSEGFKLVDIGSTNGTTVNAQKVLPKKEYLLKEDDRITIGQFVIYFHPQNPVNVSTPRRGDGEKVQSIASPVLEEDRDVIQSLRRVLREEGQSDPSHHEKKIKDMLRACIQKMNSEEANDFLDRIEASFSETMDPSSKVSVGVLQSHSASQDLLPNGSQPDFESAKGFEAIAKKYLKDSSDAFTPERIEQLIERIDKILEVTLKSLADAIRGRRLFEREFEVEATRILSWTPNPIKLAQDWQQIGAYLLDSRGDGAAINKMGKDLEEVFQDLALHQLGLIAGFRESYRGLLAQFKPELFEEEARSSQSQLGPFKASSRFSAKLQAVAWQRFTQKHRQLTEEEVRVFESILAPQFAKGYLSVQQTKGSS